jgi:hypothetical protein
MKTELNCSVFYFNLVSDDLSEVLEICFKYIELFQDYYSFFDVHLHS